MVEPFSSSTQIRFFDSTLASITTTDVHPGCIANHHSGTVEENRSEIEQEPTERLSSHDSHGDHHGDITPALAYEPPSTAPPATLSLKLPLPWNTDDSPFYAEDYFKVWTLLDNLVQHWMDALGEERKHKLPEQLTLPLPRCQDDYDIIERFTTTTSCSVSVLRHVARIMEYMHVSSDVSLTQHFPELHDWVSSCHGQTQDFIDFRDFRPAIDAMTPAPALARADPILPPPPSPSVLNAAAPVTICVKRGSTGIVPTASTATVPDQDRPTYVPPTIDFHVRHFNRPPLSTITSAGSRPTSSRPAQPTTSALLLTPRRFMAALLRVAQRQLRPASVTATNQPKSKTSKLAVWRRLNARRQQQLCQQETHRSNISDTAPSPSTPSQTAAATPTLRTDLISMVNYQVSDTPTQETPAATPPTDTAQNITAPPLEPPPTDAASPNNLIDPNFSPAPTANAITENCQMTSYAIPQTPSASSSSPSPGFSFSGGIHELTTATQAWLASQQQQDKRAAQTEKAESVLATADCHFLPPTPPAATSRDTDTPLAFAHSAIGTPTPSTPTVDSTAALEIPPLGMWDQFFLQPIYPVLETAYCQFPLALTPTVLNHTALDVPTLTSSFDSNDLRLATAAPCIPQATAATVPTGHDSKNILMDPASSPPSAISAPAPADCLFTPATPATADLLGTAIFDFSDMQLPSMHLSFNPFDDPFPDSITVFSVASSFVSTDDFQLLPSAARQSTAALPVSLGVSQRRSRHVSRLIGLSGKSKWKEKQSKTNRRQQQIHKASQSTTQHLLSTYLVVGPLPSSLPYSCQQQVVQSRRLPSPPLQKMKIQFHSGRRATVRYRLPIKSVSGHRATVRYRSDAFLCVGRRPRSRYRMTHPSVFYCDMNNL